MRAAVLAALAIGGADLATKWVVRTSLAQYQQVEIVGDYLRLTYIYNPGAAFGIYLGPYSRPIFLILGILALVVVVAMLVRVRDGERTQMVALPAILGGALGNLANRVLIEQGVVDWIDVGVGALRWPVFNLADIAITTGAVLLAISLWREESPPRRQMRESAAKGRGPLPRAFDRRP